MIGQFEWQQNECVGGIDVDTIVLHTPTECFARLERNNAS